MEKKQEPEEMSEEERQRVNAEMARWFGLD